MMRTYSSCWELDQSNTIQMQEYQSHGRYNLATSENKTIGTVTSLGDGIARVYGMEGVMPGELLEFTSGSVGIALHIEKCHVGVVLLSSSHSIEEVFRLMSTGVIVQIPVGSNFCGRIINALARPIDTFNTMAGTRYKYTSCWELDQYK